MRFHGRGQFDGPARRLADRFGHQEAARRRGREGRRPYRRHRARPAQCRAAPGDGGTALGQVSEYLREYGLRF